MEIRPFSELAAYLEILTEGKLWLKVILAILCGVLLGIAINPRNSWISESISLTLASWLELPGQLFMKLTQMVMIPLVFTSIIIGIVANNMDKLKSMGLQLLAYFVFTTAISIIIGTVLSLIINPGKYIFSLGGFPSAGTQTLNVVEKENPMGNIPQAISNLIPHNPFESILNGEMLGIVVFTIIIGVAVTQLENTKASPMIRFAEAIQKICMIVISWAIRLVPYAVFGLVAALLSKIGVEIFVGLGYYFVTVLLGLILLVIFYLLIITIVTRKFPVHFLSDVREPQLLAFSTASSAAVMPLSIKTAKEKLNISSEIRNFVIPIGTTINMDGTALFQCVTTIFMAQAYGVELSVMNLMLITGTIVAASIGTPAIPGGGVLILASILQSVGIPVEGLIIIIGIDRILGMFRTAVNVTGDLTSCIIFEKLNSSDSN